MPKGMGCCGALTHHMGKERSALRFAKANIDAWTRELEAGGLDAVVINASGCGTTVKDYGFMLREDPAYAEKAARISALTKDVTEVLAASACRRPTDDTDLVVAYHSACSMQHGQKITGLPKQLLAAGRASRCKDVPEGHLCCGSAGTYNILQPEIAGRLRDRKVANIERTAPGRDRHRQHRLHHPDRARARRSRSCTRSSCSTGPPAGRGRRRWPAGERVCDGRHEPARWLALRELQAGAA